MTDTLLRTEADVARSLAGQAVTIDELYAACEAAGVTGRDNGHQPIKGRGSDTVWRRRARNALQALKAADKAERIGDATWLIGGTRERPEQMLYVMCDDPGELSLALADAATFLRQSDDPFDMLCVDAPYQLYGATRDGGEEFDPCDRGGRIYQRGRDQIVPGYVEVPADTDYGDFTLEWMSAAADALDNRGYLAVVTGTDMAWRIGAAAHELSKSGRPLHLITQLAVARRFSLRTTRRPSNAHWVVNVFSPATRQDKKRYFAVPPELPRARSGATYPLDHWMGDAAPAKEERRGLLRYRNALPVDMVDRLVRMFTPGPETGHAPWTSLIGDPFAGSGTTAVVALLRQRRFRGCDINPESLRFAAARIAVEEQPPVNTQLSLDEAS